MKKYLLIIPLIITLHSLQPFATMVIKGPVFYQEIYSGDCKDAWFPFNRTISICTGENRILQNDTIYEEYRVRTNGQIIIPEVDFSKKYVLFVFSTEADTGVHSKLIGVSESEDSLDVHITTFRLLNSGGFMVVTHRLFLIVIPKIIKSINIVYNHDENYEFTIVSRFIIFTYVISKSILRIQSILRNYRNKSNDLKISD